MVVNHAGCEISGADGYLGVGAELTMENCTITGAKPTPGGDRRLVDLREELCLFGMFADDVSQASVPSASLVARNCTFADAHVGIAGVETPGDDRKRDLAKCGCTDAWLTSSCVQCIHLFDFRRRCDLTAWRCCCCPSQLRPRQPGAPPAANPSTASPPLYRRPPPLPRSPRCCTASSRAACGASAQRAQGGGGSRVRWWSPSARSNGARAADPPTWLATPSVCCRTHPGSARSARQCTKSPVLVSTSIPLLETSLVIKLSWGLCCTCMCVAVLRRIERAALRQNRPKRPK